MVHRVYTVGHSNRSLGEFLRILKLYGISVIIDVRRWPRSRVVPWFCREVLENALHKEGIGYIWLGELLGGYRPGGYVKYMESEAFRRGLEQLVEIVNRVEQGFPAIMCRERLWFKCHRRFIADKLVELGYEVIHIIDIDRVQKHRPITH